MLFGSQYMYCVKHDLLGGTGRFADAVAKGAAYCVSAPRDVVSFVIFCSCCPRVAGAGVMRTPKTVGPRHESAAPQSPYTRLRARCR